MRRALQRAAGVLLVTGVVGLACPALARTSPYLLGGQQAPVRTVQFEESTAMSEGHSRLEEMKVQLALLSDVATFPYYLGARASGEMMEVRGYVPNDLVRQRALELARRSTFLNVTDGLKIHTSLSPRPSLRGVAILRTEGAELLAKNLGEVGRRMRLEARPNGLVEIRGPIDSVEEKVAVSKLFRQLSGCSGVINQLSVQPILRDGQRVVSVTQDGAQTVPLSALGMEPEPVVAPPAAPRLTPIAPAPIAENAPPAPAMMPQKLPEVLPRKEPATLPPPRPTLPPPTALPRRGLDAKEGELRLPTILPVKPVRAEPPPTKEGIDQTVYPTINPAKMVAPVSAEVVTSPKPATGRSRSPISWESETKTDAKAKSVTIQVSPPAPAAVKTSKPARSNKSDTFASDAASRRGSTSGSADALTAPTPPTKWNHPIPWNAETPAKPTAMQTATAPVKATPVAPPAPAIQPVLHGSATTQPATSPERTVPTAPKAPTDATALRPAHRWPPAYQEKPPESDKGRPGIIIFEDEPAPQPTVQPAATGVNRAIVAADLKRQVKAVCGRQARDVLVEVQRDGSVLVKVKVANATAEQQLPSKIMTIPEMSAPNVHLATEIGPP